MNILIRKLIFNEADIHLILWNNKPCFIVSELSKALDSVNKEDISVYLRYGGSAAKGIDFDVVAGAEAKDLRKQLEDSGIKKKFAHTMIIYFDGLRKYFNYRKTVESKDFINYLLKCKVSLDSDSVNDSPSEDNTTSINVSSETVAEPIVTIAPIAEDKIKNKSTAPKNSITSSNSEVNIKHTDSKKKETMAKSDENKKPKTNKKSEVDNKALVSKKIEAINKPALNIKSESSQNNTITTEIKKSSSNYSDFLKHISFMEEFVETFNKLNITSDKSVAFTKSMAKYLESNGIQLSDFLKELKKWIV